jgi:hypothetical protein
MRSVPFGIATKRGDSTHAVFVSKPGVVLHLLKAFRITLQCQGSDCSSVLVAARDTNVGFEEKDEI